MDEIVWLVKEQIYYGTIFNKSLECKIIINQVEFCSKKKEIKKSNNIPISL